MNRRIIGAGVTACAAFCAGGWIWLSEHLATSHEASAQQQTLPAGAAEAAARLAASPRHGEWAVIRTGNDSIRAWVVHPERRERAPVIVVIHEIFGLSNWIRAVADQLAADGFLAIAPDLLTMKSVPMTPAGEPNGDSARVVIRSLQPADLNRYLSAVADWGMKQPSALPKYGVVGLCWGGAASFNHAVAAPGLGAAVVYYGGSPDPATLSSVRAPVLGLYADNDARVNNTVPAADSAMKALGKSFEHRTFSGSGHGFLRAQDGQNGANLAATREAWPMTVQFFRRQLAP